MGELGIATSKQVHDNLSAVLVNSNISPVGSNFCDNSFGDEFGVIHGIEKRHQHHVAVLL
jgi:hypothetical protein